VTIVQDIEDGDSVSKYRWRSKFRHY